MLPEGEKSKNYKQMPQRRTAPQPYSPVPSFFFPKETAIIMNIAFNPSFTVIRGKKRKKNDWGKLIFSRTARDIADYIKF